MRRLVLRCRSLGLSRSPGRAHDRQIRVGLFLEPLIVEIVRRSSACVGLSTTVVNP